jgi:acetyltransferase-like isoleucine patch superfamily enzyme
MKKLIILGTGGNSIEILDTVNDINENSVVAGNPAKFLRNTIENKA